jgi:hypothetical protein
MCGFDLEQEAVNKGRLLEGILALFWLLDSLESDMTETRVERGTCRFVARNNEQGKSIIRVEVFDGAVSLLKNASLSFNLLGGISLE